jgi:hypothetical protein
MLSRMKLSDVKWDPTVLIELPAPLRVAESLALKFQITRQVDRRWWRLDVVGIFRVTQVGFDAQKGLSRQLLSVEASGPPPVWQSVRKPPRIETTWGPARFPRQAIA